MNGWCKLQGRNCREGVAVLKPNKSLRDTFYYNENKFKAGEAQCLLAENYPGESAQLNEADKLSILQKMAALQPGVKVNSLHISLNFDPFEMLSEDQLRAIARALHPIFLPSHYYLAGA